jgi:hypothetical protein
MADIGSCVAAGVDVAVALGAASVLLALSRSRSVLLDSPWAGVSPLP